MRNMSAYHDRPRQPSRAELVGRSIDGIPRLLAVRLALVVIYIESQAKRYGGDFAKVPCPDPQEWTSLASDRPPVLPSDAVLRLFATDKLRALARHRFGGDLRQAYFATAQNH